MFGFGKRGRLELIKKVTELSIDGSNQIFNYLKEDSIIYGKCINDNPIKNTTTLFLIYIYNNMLSSKYFEEDVFIVIYTVVSSLANDEVTKDMILKTYFDYVKQCNNVVEYYKKLPNFDVADVLTKTFFGFIIDDRNFLINELENTIVNSNCFRKIYNYINGIIKYNTLLNEEYRLRLKK